MAGYPTFTVDAAFGSYPADAVYNWTQIHSTASPYLNATAHTGSVREVSWQRGLSDLLGRTETGGGTIVLRNQTRWWDPENTASPFYPNVIPGLPFRVRATIGATTYPVFQHFADGFPQNRYRGGTYTEVAVPTIDAFARLALASPTPDIASLTVDLPGVNNTIVYTANQPGIAEEEITISYTAAGKRALLITVNGKAINVRYHLLGFHGDPDHLANDVIAAINAHPGASQLVTATNGPGSDGTGTIGTDFGPTNLAGGDAAAFPQELAGARIGRCLDQGGWPTALRDIDTGTVQVQAMSFSSNEQGRLLTHVLDVAGEPGEFGLAYVNGAGECRFLDRNSLFTNPLQATADATFSDRRSDGYLLYVDSEPNTSREHVINEWQGSRDGGVAIIVRDDDSIATSLGRVTHNISSLLTSDTQVQTSLEFGRDEYSQPIQVLQSLTVMPGNDLALWQACLSLDVGSRVRVLSHPPGGGAAIDKLYLVTRVAGHLGIGPPATGQFTYGLWPIRVTNYFIFDDATFGTLDQTVLLLHCDGADASTTFTDSAGSHAVTAVGDAQIDTAQSKFGGASALFDGAGDYLSVPDSDDFEFGTGDFTIDFWIRFNSVVGGHWFLHKMSAIGYSPFALYQSDTALYIFATTTDGSWNLFNTIQITTGLTTGAWYHIAIVRSSGTWYAFKNGVQTWTAAGAGALLDTTTPVLIGSYTGGAAAFSGWLDEIRFSKGIARWTSNFTPPTSAYGAFSPVLAYN